MKQQKIAKNHKNNNMEKKLRKKKLKGFTLLEMLIVLLIISVLILLFAPNLSRQKDNIDKKGNAAIIKVVETQMDVYRLENDQTPTVDTLLSEGYITQEQYDKYQANK
ncbi:competence type IV pilus major pilin ComGC [Enterococcus sp. LJL128]|uniref:competence type IV pilus major pilin ComGC n=1 Tax=Enterococcus sp. LJL51 TaxID=3416656 RepID=UPI003CECB1C4